MSAADKIRAGALGHGANLTDLECRELRGLLAAATNDPLNEESRPLVMLLDDALNLLTPGVWGRERGYDVPSGDDWKVARIKLMREAGRHTAADHLYADEVKVLSAFDQSDGTERARDFANKVFA